MFFSSTAGKTLLVLIFLAGTNLGSGYLAVNLGYASDCNRNSANATLVQKIDPHLPRASGHRAAGGFVIRGEITRRPAKPCALSSVFHYGHQQ